MCKFLILLGEKYFKFRIASIAEASRIREMRRKNIEDVIYQVFAKEASAIEEKALDKFIIFSPKKRIYTM